MSTTELIELIKLIEVQGQEKLKQKMASNTRVSFKIHFYECILKCENILKKN